MPATRSLIDRSQMAQWMGKVGFEIEPLADYAMARIKQGERIFADETSLPTLAPGSGKARTAWLWTYVRDDRPFGGSGPPIVVYRFEDSRAGECVARHIEGYSGILQVDGYAAYHRLARPDRANEGVRLAACWSHVRRKFYELHVSDASVIASQTLAQMASLWAVEGAARGQDAGARTQARQETSAAVVRALFALWERALPRLSSKSKLAEAIRYALTRRASLERFLLDGANRTRLQHCRARNPSSNDHAQERIVRRIRRRRANMGCDREPSGDGQNEQCRSPRLAHPSPRAHRRTDGPTAISKPSCRGIIDPERLQLRAYGLPRAPSGGRACA